MLESASCTGPVITVVGRHSLTSPSRRCAIGSEPSWSGINADAQTYVVLDASATRSRHPVWLYEHSNFAGRTLRATGDVADLDSSGLNDATSSIFISFGTWQFCEDANYRGRCVTLVCQP